MPSAHITTTHSPSGGTLAVGDRYDSHIEAKHIAKHIRAYVKKAHPGFKFSVRSETYAGGQSVTVEMRQTPADHPLQDMVTYTDGGCWLASKSLRKDFRAIEDAANRYTHQDIDHMTDLCNVSCYIHTQLGHDLRMEAIAMAKLNEALPE